MRDAERRGQGTGKAPGLRKRWGRSGPVTRGPESRQGGWGEEKVGDAATVHVGASPVERPDRQMDEDRMEQARETDPSQLGAGTARGRPPPPTQAPAALTPCILTPSSPCRHLSARWSHHSQSLSRPCARSFPPGQSSRQPPLPLCLTTNRGLPASLRAPRHSLTHTPGSHSRPAPPRTVSAAVSPSLASRLTSRVRLCVSGSPSVSLCGCPRSVPLPTSAPPPPLRPAGPGAGWSSSRTAPHSHLSAQSQPAPGGGRPSDGLGRGRPSPCPPCPPPHPPHRAAPSAHRSAPSDALLKPAVPLRPPPLGPASSADGPPQTAPSP